ncbi:MAG TPA: hypothetical protein VJO35_11630 [Terriglobales bacterium]|nr:hypothetical protein [Terriglobales bacterium]
MLFSRRLFAVLLIGLVLPIGLAARPKASTSNDSANSNQNQPARDLRNVPLPNGEMTIPGPLRSFERMAGISQKVSPDQVVPLLARNIYVQGYIGWRDNGSPTEFLILLGRYVNQAKELAALAGESGMVRISGCDQAGPLLKILGYRLRGECGQPNAALVTDESERAFLTVDSGFPLPALEDALRKRQSFNYPFPSSTVPMLFTASDWRSAVKPNRRRNYNDIELFLYHPALARLYWAMSRIDPETRGVMQQSIGLKRLLPLAADLDFYGSQICVRGGRVQVPGGEKAEPDWKDLAGGDPASPADFVPKLLSKDNGWLAAYYDSFTRISRERQAWFTDNHRLKTFYAAFRGSDFSSDAARPAFRLAPGLLLLLARVQWDENGQPLVPGGLEFWRQLLNEKSDRKPVRAWGRRSVHWTHPEDLLDAMFAFSRSGTTDTPLQMYLMFSEMDAARGHERRLTPDTLRVLAKHFDDYNEQYLIFTEFPELNDQSIINFITTADALNGINNHNLRGNAMGTFQANVGLWQVLARQQQIPRARLNESWQEVLKPFTGLTSSAQLFEAGRKSLTVVLRATNSREFTSQDDIIELIAGPQEPGIDGKRVHDEIAKRIHSVMDGQRLVSLDTLFALDNGLTQFSKGEVPGSSLLSLAGALREFEMPRPIFTSSERTEWAAGIYNNHHTEMQMQTDLAKILKSTPTHAKLEEARGELAPFLRDTLVGLNYAYYEPPGAQLLRINPLFVRSHDFSGETVVGVEGLWRSSELFGQGSAAGGGAHLVGSLADLAYVLSDAEQDFIAPENVQALIWKEVVPGLMSDAILGRWWNVSRTELHAVALYQRAGEELVTQSASNADLRSKVVGILSERMVNERVAEVQDDLRDGTPEQAIVLLTPADTFYLTAEFRQRFPDDTTSWGAAGRELDQLCRQDSKELSWDRLSRDFGVPHRTLAMTYTPELLNVKPFPAFAGYSSRLMAESWDSNNLYWARLADEAGYAPVMLNLMAPELTRLMVQKIFATDFEDWDALLRAMREAGEEFKQGKIALLPPPTRTAREFHVQ